MANFDANQHLYQDRTINHWEYTHDTPSLTYFVRRKAYALWLRLSQEVPNETVPASMWTDAQLHKLLKINHLRSMIRVQHRQNAAVERMAWWLAPDYRVHGISRTLRTSRYGRGRTWRSMPRRTRR